VTIIVTLKIERLLRLQTTVTERSKYKRPCVHFATAEPLFCHKNQEYCRPSVGTTPAVLNLNNKAAQQLDYK
jgi:hypothetical protein